MHTVFQPVVIEPTWRKDVSEGCFEGFIGDDVDPAAWRSMYSVVNSCSGSCAPVACYSGCSGGSEDHSIHLKLRMYQVGMYKWHRLLHHIIF